MSQAKKNSASTFAAYVADIMSPLGDVSTRPMFGGYSVAVSGITFALILNGRLYFKTDETTRPAFVRAGLGPFSYTKQGKTIATSYFEAPDCLDDWDALEPWADGAISVARRSKAAKKPAAKKAAKKPAAKKLPAKTAPSRNTSRRA